MDKNVIRYAIEQGIKKMKLKQQISGNLEEFFKSFSISDERFRKMHSEGYFGKITLEEAIEMNNRIKSEMEQLNKS